MGSTHSCCCGPSEVEGQGSYKYVVEFGVGNQFGSSAFNADVTLTLVGTKSLHTVVLLKRYHPLDCRALLGGTERTLHVQCKEWLGDVVAVVVNFGTRSSLAAQLMHKMVDGADFGSLIRDPATLLNADNALFVSDIQVNSVDALDIQSWTFPMHRWFSVRDSTYCGVAFSTGAYLPQSTPGYLRNLREIDLRSSAKLTSTLAMDGAIPAVADQPLPLEHSFNDAKMGDVIMDGISLAEGMLAAFLGVQGHRFLGAASSFPTFESFNVLYEHNKFGIPWRAKDNMWRRDEVWGAAFLVGPNAGSKYLRKITDIPASIAHLDDEALQGPGGVPHPYLDGTSFAAELDAGRLFLVEHPVLKGMSFSPEMADMFGGKYLAEDGVCLLRARPGTPQEPFALLPLAIVLEPRRGADAPVFLPSDPEYEWLNARCHIMNASAQCHQIGTHFMHCHAASEPVCVATFTTLSYLHPLRRLLMPHVQYTLSINGNARTGLVAPAQVIENGFSIGPHAIHFNETCAKAWSDKLRTNVEPDGKSFAAAAWQDWEGYKSLPGFLQKYGLDSPALENFPWREDAKLIWDALGTWIRSYIDIYYESDASVKADVELGSWVCELVRGLGKPGPAAPLKEYEAAACSKKALIELLQSYIFTVSAEHAWRNFCQYENYAFPPFMPVNMRKPVPTAKGQCTTERQFLDSLSAVSDTAMTVGNLVVLSDYSSGDQYIGSPEVNWLTDPLVSEAWEAYRVNLKDISTKIEKRNVLMRERGLTHFDYPYLNPTAIPTSVAI